MGLVYKEEKDFFVYEAVQPVKLTKLAEWVNRGKDKHYVVKRLKDSNKILTEEGIAKMKKIAAQYIGKDYDLQFNWSDERIYCSELVWKIYKEAFDIEIGKLEKMGSFDLTADSVQSKIKERFVNGIPPDELVITPERMFKSAKLFIIKKD